MSERSETSACRGCAELERLLLYSHRNGWSISQTEHEFRAGKKFSNGNMRLIPLQTLAGALERLQETDRAENRKPSARQFSNWKDDQYHGR